MREKLPPDEYLYTVLLGVLLFLLGIGLLLSVGSRTHGAAALRVSLVLGFLLNILVAVHRFSKRREYGYYFLAAAGLCLYLTFR